MHREYKDSRNLSIYIFTNLPIHKFITIR